jgi:hypothetical protein
MGAGKTTVIGPLLALILADGKSLVTQVVPSALLQMSRTVLRSRFSAIIVKPVHTLWFERTLDLMDSSPVKRLKEKLEWCRRERGVLVATPESVKSIQLKFVELHTYHVMATAQVSNVPQVSNALTPWGQRERERERVAKVKATTVELLEHLAGVMGLFRSGVLLLDEVDLLLHPLRSELNFPLGVPHALDLSPQRWLLPIHLLSALVLADSQQPSSAVSAPSKTPEAGGTQQQPGDLSQSAAGAHILAQLRVRIQNGYANRRLQRNPHLVLLSPEFYRKELMPSLAEWYAPPLDSLFSLHRCG